MATLDKLPETAVNKNKFKRFKKLIIVVINFENVLHNCSEARTAFFREKNRWKERQKINFIVRLMNRCYGGLY